jgi:hypothetical protein
MIISKECAIISAIKFNGYKIELSENSKGKINSILITN